MPDIASVVLPWFVSTTGIGALVVFTSSLWNVIASGSRLTTGAAVIVCNIGLLVLLPKFASPL